MLELLRTHNILFPLSKEELKREVKEIVAHEQRWTAHPSCQDKFIPSP
ncbi:MAG: hypothetical protein ACUVTD_06805 [Nitrososphaerales archaeon]